MKDNRQDSGDLMRENRQLKKTIHALLDELDTVAGVDTNAVREGLPAVVTESEKIRPPWEREGYEDKQAWLVDREGGDESGTGDPLNE